MCGRYVSLDDRAIEEYWRIGARESGQWIRHYNVTPSTQVPLLHLNEQGQLELDGALRGLIPPWWSKPSPARAWLFSSYPVSRLVNRRRSQDDDQSY